MESRFSVSSGACADKQLKGQRLLSLRWFWRCLVEVVGVDGGGESPAGGGFVGSHGIGGNVEVDGALVGITAGSAAVQTAGIDAVGNGACLQRGRRDRRAVDRDLIDGGAERTAADGGQGIRQGQMTKVIDDWCFDPAREVGDYGIVETEYGYHLIYFSSRTGTTYRNYMIENTLRNADFDEWYKAIIDVAKYTVHDTSKLNLSISFSN